MKGGSTRRTCRLLVGKLIKKGYYHTLGTSRKEKKRSAIKLSTNSNGTDGIELNDAITQEKKPMRFVGIKRINLTSEKESKLKHYKTEHKFKWYSRFWAQRCHHSPWNKSVVGVFCSAGHNISEVQMVLIKLS